VAADATRYLLPAQALHPGGRHTRRLPRQGDGPRLLLHGCPFSCFVWRKTIPLLTARYRCIAPDLLGLGDTQTPSGADWSLPAQAATVLGLLDALQIDAAHLVGHDHGAAVAQLLAADHPHRIRRLVITNAEAYDNWPSHQELPFLRLAQLPLVGTLALWAWSKRPVLRLALRTGRAVHNPAVLTPELMDGYIRANFADRQRRAKTRRFLAGQLDPANQRHTLAALPGPRRFDHPTLLIWAATTRTLDPNGPSGSTPTSPAPTSSSSYPPPAISSWRSNPSGSPRSSPTSSPSPAAPPPHRPPAPDPAVYQHPNHRSLRAGQTAMHPAVTHPCNLRQGRPAPPVHKQALRRSQGHRHDPARPPALRPPDPR
jgi:pimeloyl-ACP methyl ester carboxylesterase